MTWLNFKEEIIAYLVIVKRQFLSVLNINHAEVSITIG